MIFRSKMEKLLVASDHAGVPLKDHLIKTIPELLWVDLGVSSTTESVDYPDYADLVCKQVNPPRAVGLLICGSGQGMAIRANRYRHIRAALCWNEFMAEMARSHNDANVLCLGSRTMDHKQCERILLTFLDTPFDGGRHTNRVEKLAGPLKQ